LNESFITLNNDTFYNRNLTVKPSKKEVHNIDIWTFKRQDDRKIFLVIHT